ncbi:hypothetical protein AB0H43_27955 [Hamadaea sp. NPDC050747]
MPGSSGRQSAVSLTTQQHRIHGLVAEISALTVMVPWSAGTY